MRGPRVRGLICAGVGVCVQDYAMQYMGHVSIEDENIESRRIDAKYRLYKNTPPRDAARRIVVLEFNDHERAVDIALGGIVGELDRAVEALAYAQQLGQPEFAVRDGEVDEVLWHLFVLGFLRS